MNRRRGRRVRKSNGFGLMNAERMDDVEGIHAVCDGAGRAEAAGHGKDLRRHSLTDRLGWDTETCGFVRNHEKPHILEDNGRGTEAATKHEDLRRLETLDCVRGGTGLYGLPCLSGRGDAVRPRGCPRKRSRLHRLRVGLGGVPIGSSRGRTLSTRSS